MSFIQVDNIGDAKEASAVDEDNYELVVAFVSDEDSKSSGKPMITLGLEIEGHSDAAMVYHYIPLPCPEDEEKASKFKLLLAARMFTLLGIDASEGIETDDLYGTSFKGFLAKEEVEQDDPNALPEFRNVLKVPKLAA